MRIAAIVFFAACAAGCGGGGITGGPQKASDWGLDACRTLPKEAASKAAGVAV